MPKPSGTTNFFITGILNQLEYPRDIFKLENVNKKFCEHIRARTTKISIDMRDLDKFTKENKNFPRLKKIGLHFHGNSEEFSQNLLFIKDMEEVQFKLWITPIDLNTFLLVKGYLEFILKVNPGIKIFGTIRVGINLEF